MKIRHQNKVFDLAIAGEADVPQLRLLVNQAYKELSDMGLNYTATYQDEKQTLERIIAVPLLVTIRMSNLRKLTMKTG